MIETKRLVINHLKIEDKKDYFINICHDKKVLATFMDHYYDQEDDLPFDRYLKINHLYAIRLKDTLKLIGIILIVDDHFPTCEIGYAIGSFYWRKGYGSEACQNFISYLWKQGYTYIRAGFFQGNIASKKVMEKVGMKYEEIHLHELNYLNESRDVIYYGIKKENKI